jgi:uncharacterized protein (TIGR02679 family)
VSSARSPELPAETAVFLRSGDLERLWGAARARLERNGVIAAGAIVIDDLTDDERHALSGVLGRPITGARVRVDLAVLDEKLRTSRAQRGLAAVLEVLGPALVDRKGRRADAEAARDARETAAREAAVAAGLAYEPWCESWLVALRPLLARLDRATAVRTARDAARTLTMLPRLDPNVDGLVARNDLAGVVTGSAHGLDDGTPLAAAVLRGVAAARGVELPTTAVNRRALWHDAGVISDQVSSTVLTLGLRPRGLGRREAELRSRADDCVETHLTVRDLRRVTWTLSPGTIVYVCENPRVVEAASDADARAALVCTFGNPTSVVGELLDRLHGAGAQFRYHGDFDWPGITIANRVIARVGATTWRMSVTDYESAVAAAGGALPDLAGSPVSALWDPDLEQAMRRAGRAVHEELVLATLVEDLALRPAHT